VPVLLYPGHPILAHESPGYLDFFGKHHRNREPVVLCDGTSVRWPAHYTKKDARIWREHRAATGMLKPKRRRS